MIFDDSGASLRGFGAGATQDSHLVAATNQGCHAPEDAGEICIRGLAKNRDPGATAQLEVKRADRPGHRKRLPQCQRGSDRKLATLAKWFKGSTTVKDNFLKGIAEALRLQNRAAHPEQEFADQMSIDQVLSPVATGYQMPDQS